MLFRSSSAHRPTPTQFGQTIGWFLKANPGDVCPSAGHAAYGESVKLSEDPGTGLMKVGSSNMMAFHTILKTSRDYYMALARARELTDSVMEFINDGIDDPSDGCPTLAGTSTGPVIGCPDTDGDGVLEFGDFCKLMLLVGERVGARYVEPDMVRMFKKVDVNGDKLIDLNEFLLMQIVPGKAAANAEIGRAHV